MSKKPRKTSKKLTPPLQRVGLELDPKTGKPINPEYWMIQCSVCLGEYWPRKMPTYSGKCAKCWGEWAPLYWRTFWDEVYAQCVAANNYTAAHKSPTKTALQTLKDVKEYHPAVPIKLIIAGLAAAAKGPRNLENKQAWHAQTLPLVESILETAPPPVVANQLTLNIFDLMLESRKEAAAAERKNKRGT